MTVIESKKQSINNSKENVYSFLSDFNNFEKLMPEQINNWQSTKDTCSFTIQGMADLNMRIAEKKESEYIKYTAEGKNPFDYFLESKLIENDNGNCIAQIIFNAKLNPMLKMMAEKPLQNFVNLLVDKLKEVMEEDY